MRAVAENSSRASHESKFDKKPDEKSGEENTDTAEGDKVENNSDENK
jgi:hypothetical protein